MLPIPGIINWLKSGLPEPRAGVDSALRRQAARRIRLGLQYPGQSSRSRADNLFRPEAKALGTLYGVLFSACFLFPRLCPFLQGKLSLILKMIILAAWSFVHHHLFYDFPSGSLSSLWVRKGGRRCEKIVIMRSASSLEVPSCGGPNLEDAESVSTSDPEGLDPLPSCPASSSLSSCALSLLKLRVGIGNIHQLDPQRAMDSPSREPSPPPPSYWNKPRYLIVTQTTDLSSPVLLTLSGSCCNMGLIIIAYLLGL